MLHCRCLLFLIRHVCGPCSYWQAARHFSDICDIFSASDTAKHLDRRPSSKFIDRDPPHGRPYDQSADRNGQETTDTSSSTERDSRFKVNRDRESLKMRTQCSMIGLEALRDVQRTKCHVIPLHHFPASPASPFWTWRQGLDVQITVGFFLAVVFPYVRVGSVSIFGIEFEGSICLQQELPRRAEKVDRWTSSERRKAKKKNVQAFCSWTLHFYVGPARFQIPVAFSRQAAVLNTNLCSNYWLYSICFWRRTQQATLLICLDCNARRFRNSKQH